MGLLIFYVTLAIAVSFLCSVMEAVLLSVTPGHLAAMENSGDPRAKDLRKYKNDIDKPLAAILGLNTVAHTVGAAGAGAQATEVFGEAWMGVFSAVLTLAILLLSEIIPKTIGAVYWKSLTGPVVAMLKVMLPALKPLVWLSGLASGLVSGGHNPDEVSREQLTALAGLGAKQGALEEDESRILQAMLQFSSATVEDVMTPRKILFGVPSTTTTSELLEMERALRFSRIPIFHNTIDELEGYVLKDEVLHKLAQDHDDIPLSELRRDLPLVPKGTKLSVMLKRLLASREHVAAVVDDYGGTEGLVSLEDIVEALLATEIVDEADHVEDLRVAARSEWLKRADSLGMDPNKTE